MECYPTSVSTHHLDHHDAIMAFGGGVQAVNCIGGNLHSGLEAKCGISANNIVINGFRYPNSWQTELFVQPRSHGKRAIAANDHQGIKFQVAESLLYIGNAVCFVKWPTPSRAQNGSTLRGYPSHIVGF